jgi:hypothetical protein
MTAPGQLLLSYHWAAVNADAEYWFEVTRADPHILVTAEFLDSILDYAARHRSPLASIELDMSPVTAWMKAIDNFDALEDYPCRVWHLGRCFAGAILKLDPRTGDPVRYVIGQYDYRHKAWEAAWPD